MGWIKFIIAIIVVLVASGTLFYLAAYNKAYAPAQPIEYSHRIHAGERKIKCAFCHENGNGKTPYMLIPSVQKCALCHRAVKPESPEVQKVLKYAEEGTEPPWKRVYGLPTSANVYFNHLPHLRAEVSCQTCHGEIEKMDRVARVVNQTMGWCIECHEQIPGQMAQVPGTEVQVNRLNDCAVCHR